MRLLFVYSPLYFLAGIVIFSACNSSNTLSKDETLVGTWTLSAIDGEEVETKEGLQFSPNKQYFLVDSQGRSVPRLIEKIWQINADTLALIDYNWEPDFIEKNGTFVYHIEAIKEDYLRLRLMNKKEETVTEYKR